jgi:ATP phosphoribosyltransferase
LDPFQQAYEQWHECPPPDECQGSFRFTDNGDPPHDRKHLPAIAIANHPCICCKSVNPSSRFPDSMISCINTRDEPIDDVSCIRPQSRVTTEYPELTKNYFARLGIPVQLFHSYGASEAKVPDLMDVVVDLTETGTTLRKNGLKIIGQIMESYTMIIANKASWAGPQKRREIEEIKTLLFGVIEARNKVLLTMNVPSASMEKIVAALPAMKKPTVSRLHGIDFYSIQTVVPKNMVNQLIPKLKACGAEDILEIPITKIVP